MSSLPTTVCLTQLGAKASLFLPFTLCFFFYSIPNLIPDIVPFSSNVFFPSWLSWLDLIWLSFLSSDIHDIPITSIFTYLEVMKTSSDIDLHFVLSLVDFYHSQMNGIPIHTPGMHRVIMVNKIFLKKNNCLVFRQWL